MIRPTDDMMNDEFWVAIAGLDIDWQKLSTSPEHFTEGIKNLSGLHSLEILEVMTLSYYRYVSLDYVPHSKLSYCFSVNLRMTDSFDRGRVFLTGGAFTQLSWCPLILISSPDAAHVHPFVGGQVCTPLNNPWDPTS